MTMGFLPTVSEILALTQPESGINAGLMAESVPQADQQWHLAIAALTELLRCHYPQLPTDLEEQPVWGGILTGPLPVFSDPVLAAGLPTWTLIADPQRTLSYLLPARNSVDPTPLPALMPSIPLLAADPLAAERFCLVLSADFSFVMALKPVARGRASFQFSFTPEVVQQVWNSLRSRVAQQRSPQLLLLDALIQQFPPQAPDYKILEQFSRLLLQRLTTTNPSGVWAEAESRSQDHRSLRDWPVAVTTAQLQRHQHQVGQPRTCLTATESLPVEVASGQPSGPQQRADQVEEFLDRSSADVELLQAIAHEVRTPLTTISTLTRLLLKRTDLPLEAIKRLEAIQRECLEQIDRFSLIFRAVELETSTQPRSPLHLSQISLDQIFQDNRTRWQKQAARRDLTLDISLPQKLPAVVSDPTMLDQVLTGLIEHLSQSLPTGSHIQLEVSLAGEQLKVQLRSQPRLGADLPPSSQANATPVLKSVGHLLMLQPETGNLSLSLPVTKNLFQALGGKLTVRKCPHQGEVLTVFLPLGPETNPY